MRRKRVAFIVQRCGREVNGGAEAHCLAIAQRMSIHWQTEVLTTCALDYVTWENFYPAGREELCGTVIRRFPVVAPRVTETFNTLSRELQSKRGSASPQEEQAWMQAQGPWCPDLAAYIEENSNTYDVFIFFTYLYWHTWTGLPKVAHRAVLVPLVHDEWTIYLNIYKQLFAQARYFIFNTIEEMRLAQRLFPECKPEGPIVGIAVDRPLDIDPLRFRRDHGIENDFLLYVGRIDPSKGCDELFELFLRYRQQERPPSKLVLLGKPVMPIPKHPDIVSLGFVSETTKWDALAACDALVMPSVNESLSMVLLEAWSVAKPVIVNGRCEVLVGQCQRSNGGLWYSSYEEWERVIDCLQRGRVAGVLGRQGWRFVCERYSWPAIERAYLECVESVARGDGRCGSSQPSVPTQSADAQSSGDHGGWWANLGPQSSSLDTYEITTGSPQTRVGELKDEYQFARRNR